jgi:foldase protein PrsA
MLLFGCSSVPDAREQGRNGLSEPESTASTTVPPVAWVDGVPIHERELRPTFIDRAGIEALTEVILDRRLTDLLAAMERDISERDIERERLLLLDTLSGDRNEATRLLGELMSRQRLGEDRFTGLLRRNAMLRALVDSDVQLTDADVERTHDLLHGERRVTRIIVAPSVFAADEVGRRLDAGESFAQLAVECSTDSSAARGGLLPPITRHDSTWPDSLRDAAWRLSPGERSDPILFRDELLIVQLEDVIPATRSLNEVDRGELREAARRMRERVLMEELARRIVEDARVTIADDALARLWATRLAK